jgi:ferritin-like metal-binding protein YciE
MERRHNITFLTTEYKTFEALATELGFKKVIDLVRYALHRERQILEAQKAKKDKD